MILDKLFDLLLGKIANAIPEKKPSSTDFNNKSSSKTDSIKVIVIDAGDEIYQFEKNVLTYKRRPRLNCGGNHLEKSLTWEEKRYDATEEQASTIINEANLIREVLSVDNVKLENESLIINYSHNETGSIVTKGTEKLFNALTNVMEFTHFYPEKRVASDKPQVSNTEQELLDKLNADKRRLAEIKEKYGKKYESLSASKAQTGSYRWAKNMQLSLKDAIDLCNHLSAAQISICSIFVSNPSSNVTYNSIEDYHRAASKCYVYARDEYTSCIVMKSGYVHVHIKLYHGDGHTYIGQNIMHDAELVVFCDSGCIFSSTVAKYEKIIKNIEEYLSLKCCP